MTYPADAVLDVDRAHRVFSGELPSYRAEKRCLTRDGGTVWVSFTATMVRDDAGKPLYGLGIVEDISERKRIEALMTRQNERLSTDLESSLAELQLSRARILASADLERRRIERDLHDGAQQRLVALRVRLGPRPGPAARRPAAGQRHAERPRRRCRCRARGGPHARAGRLSIGAGGPGARRGAAHRGPQQPAPRQHPGVGGRAAARGHRDGRLLRVRGGAPERGQARAARDVGADLPAPGQELRFEVRDDGVGFAVERHARGRRPRQHARPDRGGRRPAGDRVRLRRRARASAAASRCADARALTQSAFTERPPARPRRRR